MRKSILAALIIGAYSFASAQTKTPEQSTVILTTYEWTPLDFADTTFRGVNFDSVLNYYVDKGVRPNPMVKNFRILRHRWGANSFKTIFLYEVDKMENLDKQDEKTNELIDASFKNETEKNKFWRVFGRAFNKHEDTIMSDWIKPKM